MHPAAARGRYDRRQSKEQRRSLRRVQLLRAAAEQLCGASSPLNVGELVRRARVDRNAFYQLFGDAQALEQALIAHTLERVAEALSDDTAQPTPSDALRHWLKRWARLLHDERALVLACLASGGAPALNDSFCERLERWSEHATSSGLIARAPDELRVRLVANAIVHAAELTPPRRPTELAFALAELVLRALR